MSSVLLVLVDVLEAESALLHTTHTGFAIRSDAVDSTTTRGRSRTLLAAARRLTLLARGVLTITFLLLMLIAKASLFHAPFTMLAIGASTIHLGVRRIRVFGFWRRWLVITAIGILLLVLVAVATLIHTTLTWFASRFASSKDCWSRVTVIRFRLTAAVLSRTRGGWSCGRRLWAMARAVRV